MVTFCGKVVKGSGLAERVFGAATANLDPASVPELEHGVYAAWVDYDGKRYGASVCYGQEDVPKFEVHVIDFEGDLLGQVISGEIVEKVSEYVHGYSTERLRQKIIHDIGLCREKLEC